MSIETYDAVFFFVVGAFFGIALSTGIVVVWLELGRREILSQYRVQSDNVGLHRRQKQEAPKQAA